MPRGCNLNEFYDGFLNFSGGKLKYIKMKIPAKTIIFSQEIPYKMEDYEYLLNIGMNSFDKPTQTLTDVSLRHIEIEYEDGNKTISYTNDEKFWQIANSYLKGI